MRKPKITKILTTTCILELDEDDTAEALKQWARMMYEEEFVGPITIEFTAEEFGGVTITGQVIKDQSDES